jgi:hypothetical protein
MTVQGFNINDFKAQYQDLARAYTFMIMVSMPPGVSSLGTDRIKYLISASSMPASTMTPLEINWQGQIFPVGSVQTFTDWSVTFRLDAAAQLRKDFTKWLKMVHDPVTNIHGDPNTYMVDQEAWHLSPQGKVISKMKLVNAFPVSVGELGFDYSSTEIVTFDVGFRYLYHVDI